MINRLEVGMQRLFRTTEYKKMRIEGEVLEVEEAKERRGG